MEQLRKPLVDIWASFGVGTLALVLFPVPVAWGRGSESFVLMLWLLHSYKESCPVLDAMGLSLLFLFQWKASTAMSPG